jgi:glycosyltransferase involved in cell wall biosynthesis
MKIAMVTPVFPPYQGGMGNVASALASKLQSRGHEVKVLTPDYGLRDGRSTGLDVRRLRAALRYGNAAFLPQLFSLVRGYDVIHLHYPFFGGSEAVALAARANHLPLVLHYHHDAVGTGVRKFIFAAHRWLLLRLIASTARRVVVTSIDYAYHSQLASTIKSAPAKFMAIPNGVDTQHFCPGPYPQQLADQLKLAATRSCCSWALSTLPTTSRA